MNEPSVRFAVNIAMALDKCGTNCHEIVAYLEENGYGSVRENTEKIFSDLFSSLSFDGHTVSVWKNELVKIANKYGYTNENI